jgi:hypothetical protein
MCRNVRGHAGVAVLALVAAACTLTSTQPRRVLEVAEFVPAPGGELEEAISSEWAVAIVRREYRADRPDTVILGSVRCVAAEWCLDRIRRRPKPVWLVEWGSDPAEGSALFLVDAISGEVLVGRMHGSPGAAEPPPPTGASKPHASSLPRRVRRRVRADAAS